MYSNFKQTSGINNYNYQDINNNQFLLNNNDLSINDSFSIDGSLISVIFPNQTLFVHNNVSNTNYNTTNSEENNSSQKDNSNILSNVTTKQNLQSLTNNITNMHNNKSNNLSDNLVSLLSGIIIESIHNGNPTLNDGKNSEDSNSKSQIKLVSGKWSLRVQYGNVSDFEGRFQIISADGSGSHWYNIKNFKSKDKLFFGNDKSAIIYGKMDFTTDNDSLKKTSDALLTISNLEAIQLTLFDKNLSNLFQGFPIYGTIDSIKIKN